MTLVCVYVLCVCTWVCICTLTWAYVHVCTHTHVCVCLDAHMHVCNVCTYMCTCIVKFLLCSDIAHISDTPYSKEQSTNHSSCPHNRTQADDTAEPCPVNVSPTTTHPTQFPRKPSNKSDVNNKLYYLFQTC